MERIERNIVASFNNAKKDIKALELKLDSLLDRQRELKKKLEEVSANELKLYHRLQKTGSRKLKKPVKKAKKSSPKKKPQKKTKHKTYVAPKSGTKFHVRNCPFAQNIKPKNKKIFKSKSKALNEGYKPCECVK